MVKFGAPKGNGGGQDPAAAAFHVAKDFAQFMVPKDELDPTIIYLNPLGKLEMAIIAGDKRAFGPAIVEILRRAGCQWYVYLMETWVTSRRDMPPGTRISDLPLDDREEWVKVLLIRKRHGIALAEEAKVVRYRDQRRLGDWQMDPSELEIVSNLIPLDW